MFKRLFIEFLEFLELGFCSSHLALGNDILVIFFDRYGRLNLKMHALRLQTVVLSQPHLHFLLVPVHIHL
jgi:hypothetical protein